MAFQCEVCSVKPYDKAWKLQRHQKETITCFKRIFPGKQLPARFKCSECGRYSSVRKPDVKRHLQRIHHMDPETAESRVLKFTCPTNTSSQTSTQVDRAAAPDLRQIASSSARQGRSLQSVMEDVRPKGSEQPISDPSTGSRTLHSLYPTPYLSIKKALERSNASIYIRSHHHTHLPPRENTPIPLACLSSAIVYVTE